MQCRYCGKPLGLLRKLADQEFCSAAHQKAYAQEQEQLVLARLLEARPASAAARAKDPIEELVPMQDFDQIEAETPLEAGFLLEEPYVSVPEYYVRNGVVPVDVTEYTIPLFPAFIIPDPPASEFLGAEFSIPPFHYVPCDATPLEISAQPLRPTSSGLSVIADPVEADPPFAPVASLSLLHQKAVKSREGSFDVPERTAKLVVPMPISNASQRAGIPVLDVQPDAPKVFTMGSDPEDSVPLASMVALRFPGLTERIAARASAAPRPHQRPRYGSEYLAVPVEPLRPTSVGVPGQSPVIPDVSLTADAPASFQQSGPTEVRAAFNVRVPRFADRLLEQPFMPIAHSAPSGLVSAYAAAASASTASIAVVEPVQHAPARGGQYSNRGGTSNGSGNGKGRKGRNGGGSRTPVKPVPELAPAIPANYHQGPPSTPPDAGEHLEFPKAVLMPGLDRLVANWKAQAAELTTATSVAVPAFESIAPAPFPELASPQPIDPEFHPGPVSASRAVRSAETNPDMAGSQHLPFSINPAPDSGAELAGPVLQAAVLALHYPVFEDVAPATPRSAEAIGDILSYGEISSPARSAAGPTLLTLASVRKPVEEWIPEMASIQALSLSALDATFGLRTAELMLATMEIAAKTAPEFGPVEECAAELASTKLNSCRESVTVPMEFDDFASMPVYSPLDLTGQR